jgi:hypothetical protein
VLTGLAGLHRRRGDAGRAREYLALSQVVSAATAARTWAATRCWPTIGNVMAITPPSARRTTRKIAPSP